MATLTAQWVGRQGDTQKVFPFICQDSLGTVDISDAVASARKFHLSKKPGATAVINAETEDVDYANGEGQYQWADGETDDLIGFYYAEVEVTFLDGRTRTFPEGDDEYAILFFSRQLA